MSNLVSRSHYHNITTDDMMNGDGLRVVLWLAGCTHHCNECQNPETWNPDGGIPFDDEALEELFEELSKSHIQGITFSGGDPLHENNVGLVSCLINKIRDTFGDKKDIWVYSGYTLEEIMNEDNWNDPIGLTRRAVVLKSDVFVDGKFEKELASVEYHWAGSTNQRVIDVKETMKIWNCHDKLHRIVLHQ